MTNLTKRIGIILIYSHQTAIVMVAVVILKFDNLREKRSEPWRNSQALHVLKILAVHWLKIADVGESILNTINHTCKIEEIGHELILLKLGDHTWGSLYNWAYFYMFPNFLWKVKIPKLGYYLLQLVYQNNAGITIQKLSW